MSELIHRHMAVAACAVGPSDEWSKSTRSGYEQAALDCTMNILRIEVEPSPALSALAMRERAADVCYKHSYSNNQYVSMRMIDAAIEIRTLPTTFTNAELLAAAMQLPEVRAMRDALIWHSDDTSSQGDKARAALAPFTKGAP